MNEWLTQPVTRRLVLAGTAGVGLAAVAGCSTDPGTDPSGPSSGGPSDAASGPALPTYQEAAGAPKPDLAGSSDLMATYLEFPTEHPVSVDGPALPTGTKISVYGTQAAPVVPMGSNRLWQAVAEDMGGVDLEFTVAPSASEHLQKLQTMLAGNDLPDIVQLAEISRLPNALESRFADLSEHLCGDAILDYPNLAAIPTWAWESSFYNGKLYTIPVTRGKLNAIPIVRADLFDAVGAPELSNGEDFRALFRDLTSAKDNQWATGQRPSVWANVVAAMMGAPNQWGVDGSGVFTHLWETDEFAAAMEEVRGMFVDDKVFHPDAASGPDPQAGFAAGTMVLEFASYAVWSFLLRSFAEVTPGSFTLPAWDGGGAAPHFVATKPFQFSGLAKADPDRIAQVLRAVDYWAAPFGSSENTLRVYGIEGDHYNLEDGTPVTSTDGQAQAPSPVSTVVSGAPTIYLPGQPEAAQQLYEIQETVVPQGVVDASVGLFSESRISDGPAIDREVADQIEGITTGRVPMSQWAETLDRWRSQGGDKIREEYQQAHAAR